MRQGEKNLVIMIWKKGLHIDQDLSAYTNWAQHREKSPRTDWGNLRRHYMQYNQRFNKYQVYIINLVLGIKSYWWKFLFNIGSIGHHDEYITVKDHEIHFALRQTWVENLISLASRMRKRMQIRAYEIRSRNWKTGGGAHNYPVLYLPCLPLYYWPTKLAFFFCLVAEISFDV